MNKKFSLKSIRLHKSPGFEAGSFPGIKKIGEYLNIIWGPNAVGKSTLTRAMRSLIWNGKNNKEVEVEGILQTPSSDWNLSFFQGVLRQTRLIDNQEIRLPGRNDELSESYWFTLHELLQEDAGHAEIFLKEVRTRMQGGVDLDLARDNAGGLSSFSRANVTEAKNAKDAIDSLKQVISEQNKEQGIQYKIEQLEQVIAQGPSLDKKKANLAKAQDLKAKKKDIDELKQKRATYNPAIKHISTGAPLRLEELKDAQKKAEGELDECIRLEEEITQEFKACSVTDHQLNDLDMPLRLKNTFDEYEKAANAQKVSLDTFSNAKTSLHEWETEHSWLMSEPPQKKILPSYVEKLKHLASECEPLRCSLDANKRLAEELGEEEKIKHSANDLSLLQIRLSDWISLSWKLLGTYENRSLKVGTKKRILLFVSLAGILASVLGIFVHASIFAAGSFVMLAIVFLLVPASKKNLAYKHIETELKQKRDDLKHMFAKMGIAAPDLWTPESCQSLALALGKEIATIQQVELLNQRRKRARAQLVASQEKVRNWYNDWTGAARAIGLLESEARLEGAQFFHFAQRLETWSELRLAYEQARTADLAAQENSARALSALQRELETKEVAMASLKAMSENLVRRLEKAARLRLELAKNAQKIERARLELETSTKALTQFWGKSGLPFASEETLKELASHVEDWEDLQRTLRNTQNSYDEISKNMPEVLKLASTYTRDDLQKKIEEIEKKRNLLQSKLTTLGGLQKTYDDLKFGSALSQAQLAQTTTQEELEAFRQNQVMGRMITVLAADLKEESEQIFQPQVLKRASEWLQDITNSRYTLSANDEGFFATDTIMAKNYKLHELSSGTRIQLLFSIRMAFIAMQEKSSEVSLPIFLDELLANSDDERASAIVQAIGKIAKERQVFYVTAQRDEVEKLKRIDSSEVNVIPLEDLTRNFKVSQVPLKPYVYEKKRIPNPIEDYHEYGKQLSVAGASLWKSILELHSWHLCTDSQELYEYLKKGLNYIGTLVHAHGSDHPFSFRLDVLEAAQNRAQEGRCKILDVSALERSTIDLNRNTNYWVQMVEKIDEGKLTGNDLLKLIDDKEIKNFSSENYEILTDWLIEQKYATNKVAQGVDEIYSSLFVMFDNFMADSEDAKVVHRWLTGVALGSVRV